MHDFKESKIQFYRLLSASLWDRTSFITWLERKVAEYKLSEQIVGRLGGESDSAREGFLDLVCNITGKFVPQFFLWLDIKLAQSRITGDFQPDEGEGLEQGQYPEWIASSLRTTPQVPTTDRQTAGKQLPPQTYQWPEHPPLPPDDPPDDDVNDDVDDDGDVSEMAAHMHQTSYRLRGIQPQENVRLVMYKRSSDNTEMLLMQLGDGNWVKGTLKGKTGATLASSHVIPVRDSVTTVAPKFKLAGARLVMTEHEVEKEKKRLYSRMHRLKTIQDPEKRRVYLAKKQASTQRYWANIKSDPEKYQAYLQSKGEYKKVWRARRRLQKEAVSSNTANTASTSS